MRRSWASLEPETNKLSEVWSNNTPGRHTYAYARFYSRDQAPYSREQYFLDFGN